MGARAGMNRVGFFVVVLTAFDIDSVDFDDVLLLSLTKLRRRLLLLIDKTFRFCAVLNDLNSSSGQNA
jgi:hypothetical protein